MDLNEERNEERAVLQYKAGEAPRVPLLANSIFYERGVACYPWALRTRPAWVANRGRAA